MSLYSIVGHPLLRRPSGVSPSVLEEQARVAERVLGLVGTTYTGDDARDAARAVVLQVNYQLARPRNPFLKSQRRGARQDDYTTADAERPTVSPEAQAIVDGLAAAVAKASPTGTFAAITSFR